MLTPQIYLLNKGPLSTKRDQVVHLFSTNCRNCTGVGSQNSLVQPGKFDLETNGHLSECELLERKKSISKIRIILF